MVRLRRLVRDLCGTLHIGMFHMNQDKDAELTVWTDGDRSGDVQTCKSTSSGAIQIGAHTVETWSVSQKLCRSPRPRANSPPSAAAKAQASPSSTCSRRSLTTPGSEQRYGMVVRTNGDAARSMLHRLRGWQSRHLATRFLWLQDALKDGLFEAERCASKDNSADVGTKALDSETRERLLGVLCIVSRAATGFASNEGQRVLAALLLWPGLVSKARERDAGQCWRYAMRSMVWVCCGW